MYHEPCVCYTFVAGEDVSDDLVDPFPGLLQQHRLPREDKVDQANRRSARHLKLILTRAY